jgi:hypothetical protein
MTSDKQLHANRANATKSIGPRSQAGKMRSRLNSRKHGLTAKMLIIVGENADDFDQLRAELMAEHDPQSVLETELVERLAGILWRLRRVPSFEAAILDTRHQQVWNQKNYALPEPEGESEETKELDEEEADWERSVDLGVALMDGCYGDTLGKIERHETSLSQRRCRRSFSFSTIGRTAKAIRRSSRLLRFRLQPDSSRVEHISSRSAHSLSPL